MVSVHEARRRASPEGKVASQPLHASLASVGDWSLPRPPTDRQKYWYLGRQHRWLLLVQAMSFAMVAYSIVRFAKTERWLLLFLIPITLYCITSVVSLLGSTRRRRTDRDDHERCVRSYRPERPPSVDVFLPSAGEPLDVLANTYRHVAGMHWPGRLDVWVLDDSARGKVRELAEAHGFGYLTRPDRGHLKKAGNLKFGFEHTSADLIVIFDADFVPRPDFLPETVPYFQDESVGIVQTPQFFDAVRGMPWLQRCAGATQELFYRWIQPARDRSGAAICVGTCAVYRRAALCAGGGFAQIGHSEDVHTGVNLMKVGYRVSYVPVLLSKGLCPDTAAAFLNQQYRWCAGSMSLLADPDFHSTPAIRWRQRTCYWAGFMYYISTAVNAFVAPMPSIIMAWLLPQYVFPSNSIWLLGALTLWLVVLPLVMRGRWRIDVLRVQMMYSFAHAVAITHTLTGRTREWVATGATGLGTVPLAVSIGRVLKGYVALTQAAILGGLAYGTARYGLANFWVMWTLAGLSAYVHAPLLALRVGSRRPSLAGLRATAARFSPTALATAPARRAVVADDVPPRHPRAFRPDIQGLRAVAVAMVVLYHAKVPGLDGGYAGVDAFFVISGFLITGQLVREADHTGRVSLLQFYAGRIRRLLVPATVVVCATVIVNRIWGSIFEVRAVSTDAVWTALYGINYHLAAQGVDYQQADGPVSPLQHFWSLSVEEQFYLVWPLVVLVFALGRHRHRWHLFGATVGLVTVASFWFSVHATTVNAPYAYFSMQSRAWELGVGAAVSLAATALLAVPGWLARLVSWLGLAAIVTSAFAYSDSTPFPGRAALLPVLGTAAVIAAGCRLGGSGAERVLRVRPMQALGRISYGLYLWHWPLLILVPVMMAAQFGWVVNLEVCALALWLAALMYHMLERPSKQWRLRRPAWPPLGAGLIAVSVAISAVVVWTLPSLVGSGATASSIDLRSAGAQQLQGDLVRALRIGAAPRNLTPSLDKVGHDQPVSTADGCHADFLTVEQPFSCVFGDPAGTHTLVLFGDSHAQQWLPGLDAEAQRLHWRLVTWTKAACPIAQVSVYAKSLRRTYTECTRWRDRTIKRIEALHPDQVVLSQSDNVPGTQVSDQQWATATAQTARMFVAHHQPVVYIMDTPVPGSDVPACVAEHIGDVQHCTRSRARIYAYPARHRELADTLHAAGITTLEPVSWFCTTRECPVVVGNVLIYRDTAHMTSAYSEVLAPLTRPLFRKAR
jgi:peptidoglycan/LPS O-acetylase OafA/YrhL/cellulose synthase/poly-beta-1,6-N-acetylglucosamine synthase-like glycosyltransferase